MVKPLALVVRATAKTPRGICVEVQVVGSDTKRVDEECTTVPSRQEGLPPVDVSQCFPVQADVVVKPLGFGAEGDEAAKEQTTCRNCSCCKTEHANQGEEFSLRGFLRTGPAFELSCDVYDF